MKQIPSAVSRIEFIIMMSLIMAVDAFSIDSILPALSDMSNEFGVTQGNERQYIVTSLFMGYALGVMIFGVISDSFGRKHPIYVGFGIFFIGMVVTIFASSFTLLLVGRVLQGLGAAQQVFQEHFLLGLYFGALPLVMLLSSYVNSRLVEKLGMHWLVLRASLLLFLASSVYLFLILLNNTAVPFWSFMLFASIAYFCFGILFGNMHSLAMEEVSHVAGVAASVIGSLSTLIAILIAAFIGSFYNDSVTPIVLGFGVLMLPIILITLIDNKHNNSDI